MGLAQKSNSGARSAGAGARTSGVVRTTLVLPSNLDRNLEIYCAMMRLSKADAVKEALATFLKERGLQPDKQPRVEVLY